MSEDGFISGDTGGSFWEVDQYKRTVKRQEDGHKLCGDLMMLIEERAKVEKDYAKSLKAWNKKWMDLVEKGPEYATMEGAFKGMLQEADNLADVHLTMKDNLLTDVDAAVKHWRSENYHKGMVGPCKETKTLEDEFKKAQKTWAKKYHKVAKGRKEYHNACKLQKTAENQETNARGDSGVSPDALKKMQEKAEKCRKDVETTKDKYEHALRELKDANPKYMEDMTEVFNKTQEVEQRRLEFFKEMLFGIHKCLQPQSYPQVENIYEEMYRAAESANYEQDLRWFSNYHGVDMPMNWPAFEEYSPELNTISRKEKKPTSSDGGITMTSIYKRNDHPPQPAASASTIPAAASTHSAASSAASANNHYSAEPRASHPQRLPSYDATLNPFEDDRTDDESALIQSSTSQDLPPPSSSTIHSSAADSTIPMIDDDYDESLNPFGGDDEEKEEEEFQDAQEDDDDTSDTAALTPAPSLPREAAGLLQKAPPKPPRSPGLKKPPQRPNRPPNHVGNPFGDDDEWGYDGVGNDKAGVPVRASYDYNGEEADELSFKAGDVFVKLKDKDDQGWCTGRINGKVGLYPDNYCEVVSQ